MPKLQKVVRVNGSDIYSINIPLDIISELGWKKGTKLLMKIQKVRDNSIIIIFKEEMDG